jgi:hypothetical protein
MAFRAFEEQLILLVYFTFVADKEFNTENCDAKKEVKSLCRQVCN